MKPDQILELSNFIGGGITLADIFGVLLVLGSIVVFALGFHIGLKIGKGY